MLEKRKESLLIMKLLYLFMILFIVISPFELYAHGKNNPDSSIVDRLSLLPKPQQVSFSGRMSQLNSNWSISIENGSNNKVSVNSLESKLKSQFNLDLKVTEAKKKGQIIRLSVMPGSVTIGKSVDTNKTAIRKQAYHLNLSSTEINIEANSDQGLFYGVQTLLQLLELKNGEVTFPHVEITDWPNLELRAIYWDDAHHLERLSAFKHAIRQAAHYKINAIALKLEGHFQFGSAKPVVTPYALSPDQYQELTDYAKERFVQIIPYLDAPAHVSFILKHPEYAHLREFPQSNYEFCVTNSETYNLLYGMFDDLLNANQGGEYFLLSTDEPYFIGTANNSNCNEEDRAKDLGGNGRLEAEFITKAANELHKKGRSVIFWGEDPLTPSDIEFLPSYLINGLHSSIFNNSYGAEMTSKFKQHGIRQMIYGSIQGSEPLFPNYYKLPENKPGYVPHGRVALLLDHYLYKKFTPSTNKDDNNLLGTIVAAWGDAGLHPETFWLGYITGSAAGWNNQSVTAEGLSKRFYKCFYGPNAIDINKVYELLSYQAQFWNRSWDWVPSKIRTPILGDSEGMYKHPKPARDQSLPLLPVPRTEGLALDSDWNAINSKRLKLAKEFMKKNNELLTLLNKNLRVNGHQHYNLRVFYSIAQLCRQNLDMLLGLKKINMLLKHASGLAGDNPSIAISFIDQALDQVQFIREERNKVFQSVVNVWYQSWYPRVAEANGRHYLQQVDDIKDHLPVRTVDMSYLIYRQLNYPLGSWAKEVQSVRNQFAKKNHLPKRIKKIDWSNTEL